MSFKAIIRLGLTWGACNLSKAKIAATAAILALLKLQAPKVKPRRSIALKTVDRLA